MAHDEVVVVLRELGGVLAVPTASCHPPRVGGAFSRPPSPPPVVERSACTQTRRFTQPAPSGQAATLVGLTDEEREPVTKCVSCLNANLSVLVRGVRRPVVGAASDRVRYGSRVVRWVVASQLLVLASCAPQPLDKVGPVRFGRYWLDNIALSATPVDEAPESIEPPMLVDVYLDGSVRGVDDATVEGYLPFSALLEPGGLSLYAQVEAEIHAKTKDGPVIGKVHPGALIPVAPMSERGRVYPRGLKYGIMFVDPEALGPEPHPAPSMPKVFEQAQTSRCGSVDVHAPGDRGSGYAWGVDPCRPIYHADMTYQWIDGVELFGLHDLYDPNMCVTSGAQISLPYFLCSATVTVRRQGTLISSHPSRHPQGRRVERPPAGQHPAVLDAQHAQVWVKRGDTVTFLIQSDHGPLCDTWRVRRRGEAMFIERSWPGRTGGQVQRSVQLRYPEYEGRPFVIHLGDYVDAEGSSLLRCRCDQSYALVFSTQAELHMLGRRVPRGALLAYDPDEVERWYLTPAACDEAAKAARERLAATPSAAVTLGYHLQEPAHDWSIR